MNACNARTWRSFDNTDFRMGRVAEALVLVRRANASVVNSHLNQSELYLH